MYEPKDVCGNLSCNNLVNYGEYLCHQCKTGKHLSPTRRVKDYSHLVTNALEQQLTVFSHVQVVTKRGKHRH